MGAGVCGDAVSLRGRGEGVEAEARLDEVRRDLWALECVETQSV